MILRRTSITPRRVSLWIILIFIVYPALSLNGVDGSKSKETISQGNALKDEKELDKTLTETRLIEGLKTSYGLDVERLLLLPLGADVHASVYKASTRDKQSYFVKVKEGVDNSHPDILDLFHKAGIRHIIYPLKTNRHQSLLHMGDFTIIVYPFVEGQDGFSCSLTDEQRQELGRTLHQIHNLDVPDTIKKQIRHESYSPQWRDYVRTLISHESLETIKDELSIQFWSFIKAKQKIIQQLIDRADQLAQTLQNEPTHFVLCHADLHGGNLFIDNQGQVYIVDWDAPILAPKERDLMFIGAKIDNLWNTPQAQVHFYEGYGKTTLNKAALIYYRYERIIEDMAEYAVEILFKNRNTEDKQTMYAHFLRMFEPNGVIETALESDGK